MLLSSCLGRTELGMSLRRKDCDTSNLQSSAISYHGTCYTFFIIYIYHSELIEYTFKIELLSGFILPVDL